MGDKCSAVLAPISEAHPLPTTSHWVAGTPCPPLEIPGADCSFESLYASHGVAIAPVVTNGDCGLDTMTLVLGIPQSTQARTDLRIELSDCLLARGGDHWMYDIMVACQELDAEELLLCTSVPSTFVAPTAVAPAVAERASVPAVADLAVAPEPFDE